MPIYYYLLILARDIQRFSVSLMLYNQLTNLLILFQYTFMHFIAF